MAPQVAVAVAQRPVALAVMEVLEVAAVETVAVQRLQQASLAAAPAGVAAMLRLQVVAAGPIRPLVFPAQAVKGP